MVVKIFNKRIVGNEVLFSAKNTAVEFAFVDVAADSAKPAVKDRGNLLCCVVFEVEGHLKRTPSLFSLMNTTFLNNPSNLIRGDINPASDPYDVLDDLFLSPVMECYKAYLEKPRELFGREERVSFGVHWIKFSIGIPVFWEMRIAALVPKVLFPLKKYDKYASVIPSSFANSFRVKLFFSI